MANNSFGEHFVITTFGESHGPALGVVIDGAEPGIFLNDSIINGELQKRRPGQSKYTTSRKESDRANILSGVFEDYTTGTPISMVIYNSDQRSGDYNNIKDIFRPGHADYTYSKKYGIRDHRGGGRSSGRETAARVAAGAVAKQILSSYGMNITAYTEKIHSVSIKHFDKDEISRNPMRCPDKDAVPEMEKAIQEAVDKKNSVGGIVSCICEGVPVGLGDPVFNKLDALIAHAMLSIGSVKGIEFGVGFSSSEMTGYEMNDQIKTEDMFMSNNSGGILGGISTGQEIFFSCAVKPTPSIGREQETISESNESVTIQISGRHDPCICPRIVPVIESMAAIVLLDRLYAQKGRRSRQ
ncbi:MAG: chorismate synthase [Spirochaetia bacterium]|nr:chorismate synthase [Spirochaetia bacterium]